MAISLSEARRALTKREFDAVELAFSAGSKKSAGAAPKTVLGALITKRIVAVRSLRDKLQKQIVQLQAKTKAKGTKKTITRGDSNLSVLKQKVMVLEEALRNFAMLKDTMTKVPLTPLVSSKSTPMTRTMVKVNSTPAKKVAKRKPTRKAPTQKKNAPLKAEKAAVQKMTGKAQPKTTGALSTTTTKGKKGSATPKGNSKAAVAKKDSKVKARRAKAARQAAMKPQRGAMIGRVTARNSRNQARRDKRR